MLLYLGGMGYTALELLWRGWTHGSMFLAGGICFLLLGAAAPCLKGKPWIVRAVAGACLITGVELLFGLVVNRMLGLRVWDYSGLPGSLMGQICLPYFFLWIWVAWLAMGLHGLLWRRLFPEADDLSR